MYLEDYLQEYHHSGILLVDHYLDLDFLLFIVFHLFMSLRPVSSCIVNKDSLNVEGLS